MGIADLQLVMTDNAFDPQDAPPLPSHQQDESGGQLLLCTIPGDGEK